eukprot:GFKZ01016095.1.p1 GENE.GFKZ01016095.1~~GFKZ01016095.1.p1  ORF type:complete len:657 (+),score=132.37 GFKZ01016095.1:144-1973(+)
MTYLNSSTVLGHFANLKLAGDRAVRDAILSLQSADPTLSTSSAMRTIFKNPAPPTSRRRRRKPRTRSSSQLHSLTDADLEAELVSRRAARARERDRYARAMRSEKLTVLESELARLRFEIARLDKGATPSFTGGGTPPNAKWESFPQARRSLQRNSVASKAPMLAPRVAPSNESPSGSGPSMPPPTAPPPPPPLAGPSVGRGGEGEDVVMDLEKQRREKEERQRRREAKRKEREAAKKPMTLADIIRSAGPDPARRLKPSGSTAIPDVNDPNDDGKGAEDIGTLKDGLKKVEQGIEQRGQDQERNEKKDGERKAENVGTRRAKTAEVTQKREEKELNAGKVGTATEESKATPEKIREEGRSVEKMGTKPARSQEVPEKRKEEHRSAEKVESQPADGKGEEVDFQDAKMHSGKLENSNQGEIHSNGRIDSADELKETAKRDTRTLGQENLNFGNTPPVASDKKHKSMIEGSNTQNGLQKEIIAEKGSEMHAASTGKAGSGSVTDAKAELAMLGKLGGSVPDTNGEAESKGDGGAAEAIAAISALAANLPTQKTEINSSKRLGHGKMSLEEKRRMRRASARVRGSGAGQRRLKEGKELEETANSVNELKVD